MKRSIKHLTKKELSGLQKGLTLYRETLERIFSIEFMTKYKNLEYATLVLKNDNKGFFFTLENESGTLLCCPDHESINLEYMIQDLFICRALNDVNIGGVK